MPCLRSMGLTVGIIVLRYSFVCHFLCFISFYVLGDDASIL